MIWRSKDLKPKEITFGGTHNMPVLTFQEELLVNMVSILHRVETADAPSNQARKRYWSKSNVVT
jgi:hypothetical protein